MVVGGGVRHITSEMMQTLAPALLTEWKVVFFLRSDLGKRWRAIHVA